MAALQVFIEAVCTTIPDAWADYPFTDPSPADLAKGYIEFFEPDVFVEARPGLAAQIGLNWADLDFGYAKAGRDVARSLHGFRNT